MTSYYTREETRAMLNPRELELFDAGINNWLEPKPPAPPVVDSEECAQLKAAYQVCKSLNMPTTPIYVRLHEIEDGY